MKRLTTLALAVAAASILGAGAAMADSNVTRIDHSNGLPTFIYSPESNGPVATTIGVFQNGWSVGRSVSQADPMVYRRDDAHGTSTFIYSPQMNGPVGVR